MTYSLKSFNTWQVTLPKKWRDKWGTNNYIAEETENGLLIRPVDSDNQVVYYEDSEGFWIYCDSGFNSKEIIDKIKKLQDG